MRRRIAMAMWLRPRTIRGRLARALVLWAAVGFAATVALWRLVVEPELHRVVGREQSQVASRAADRIDSFVADRIEALRTIAEVGELWRAEPERQRASLQRVLEMDPTIHEVNLLDPHGRPLQRLSRLRLIEPGEEDPLGMGHLEPVLAGADHVGSVYHSRTAEPMVTIAVPVRSTPRDVAAVLSVEVSLRTLWRSLSRVSEPERAQAFVVDSQGGLIAHQDFSRVLRQDSMIAHPAVHRCLARPRDDDGPAMVSRPSGGGDLISSCARAQRVPWIVVVEEPESVALAGVYRLERIWLVFGGLAVGLAFGIAYWFGHRIGGAASSLRQGVERIAQGDLTHRLPGGDGDEFGIVAERFNAMADELQRSRGAIEDEVDERRRAEEAAARANAAKSEFLSRMSHELRTPLNAVLGFAQILETDLIDREQRDSIGHILRAGRHLLKLIDDVLDISRIEQGHTSVSLEPVALGEVVEDAVALVGPLAAEHRVACRSAGRARLWVRADRRRLQQVLLNLLSNGVKYNRPGGEVRVECAEAPGGRIRLLAIDTGIGIRADRMARLFTPFDRLGAENTAVQGTGLGLTLTRGLVELMGGTLTVTSEAGRGTEVTVELEAATDPVAAIAPAESAPARGVLPPGTTRTILYVEDTASNRLLMTRLLSREPGLQVVIAECGMDALRLVRERRPDAILLDLQLPDLDGLDVLERLRADPSTADIPVTMLSADATAASVAECERSGAMAYLTKPIDVGRLRAVLRDMLRADAACAPAPAP